MIRSITFLITVIVTGLSAGTLFAQHLNSTHATTSAPVVSFRSAVPMRTVITAQNKEGVRSPWQPHLGLVLSGGGARGLAQIGLLRALEEAGIRPDLIVGTSIGSIIGGLYASGYNARRLQHTIRDIEWNKIMRMHDAADRNFLSLDHKPISDRSILTLRFDGLQPILPQAVSNGQRLTNLLNELTLQALYHADDFDHLGIPFRAVATDLHSGKSVTLSSGGLAECMRASSTLPVMYSPVVRDSLLLVDGGLLANIPVNVARAEGCEYILAVNTTSPLRDSDQLNTAFDVIDQVFNIVMIPPGEEQLAQADMVIAPDLRHVDGMDFSIADSLIAIGYASAKEKVNILREELNAMAVRRMPRPEEAQTLYHLRSVPDGIAHSTWYDRAHDIDVLYSKAVQIANEGKHARVEVLLHSDATAEIVMSPSTRVTSINVVGNTLLSNAVLAGLESRWIGTPINEWTQRGISEYLLEDYRKQGFSLAQVDSLYILPDGAIHMWVDEGVVERISVRGNTRTNHVVILREIPVRAGSVFRMADMKRGMENLFALDLFHSVAYDILRNDDQIHLVIRVVERPSKILQTGLLVDNERNAQLGLLLRDANFLGSGTEIAASFFGGHNIREYAVQFSSNRLFYTPFNTRIRAFYGFRDYNGYADVPDLPKHRFARDIALVYRSIDYGAAASFGIYVQRFGHLQAKLRYAQQSIRTDQLRNPDVDPITEEHRLVEWGLSSTVDTQDKYPYPNKGILFEGEYTSALRALGSEIAFTRLTLGYDFYVPVIPDHLVLHPRIRFGYGDKTMPRTEEFRIGGLYSFIGMRENEYNGRQIILGGMELRYALPVRILFDAYLSMRYDLGRTWANPELVKLEDLRHGVGLQLGLDTPIGPADFAVGRSFYFLRANPVTPVKWGPVHLYFTIGARL